MPYPTLRIENRKYVLVPADDFARLMAGDGMDVAVDPPLPELNPDGTYPALAAARATIARTIIRQRADVGLTQKGLAELAGIRVETLNRIERARVTADTATIAKIDRALKKAAR